MLQEDILIENINENFNNENENDSVRYGLPSPPLTDVDNDAKHYAFNYQTYSASLCGSVGIS